MLIIGVSISGAATKPLTFEQRLSANTHSNLVIIQRPSKQSKQRPIRDDRLVKVPIVASGLLSYPTIVRLPDNVVVQKTMVHDTNQAMVSNDAATSIKLKGPDEKKRVLDQYQENYGSEYPNSIIVAKKGKLSTDSHSPSRNQIRMKASIKKSYRVKEITIYDVITIIIKTCISCFTPNDILSIRLMNRDFSTFIPKVIRWLDVDFTPLRQPRYNYEEQATIDMHRVEMSNALMVHYGLDPGKAVRYLGGEYVGAYRDARTILSRVQDHISNDDYEQMKRILTEGTPAEFQYDESLANKSEMIRRGNSVAFDQNTVLVDKTINKEERYSHIVALDPQMCTFSPYCRVTSQSLIEKEGKNPRLVWDGTTTLHPDDEVMNLVTPTSQEAPITFGTVKIQFLIDLYNLRISYPTARILLALADIKACFRFARIHPDLTGAFGFFASGYFLLAIAMVFGSTVSASSWEPFRRAIEALSLVYADRPDLVIKHRHYLDMIIWADIDSTVTPVTATPCDINQGVLDSDGNRQSRPARIFVDDTLMMALGKAHMEMVLAAIIEAIFTVMGEPDIAVRQCPLAMDKWISFVVDTNQVMLGLIINTDRMTVGIPQAYLTACLNLLNSTWHSSRRRFKVKEAQQMVGKLARLADGANWVHHLLSHVYTSIAAALAENVVLLAESSQEFKDVIRTIRTGAFTVASKDQAKHVTFALKRAARMTHGAKYQYNINSTMRSEIEFFREYLQPDSKILWETPIALLIPRSPSAIVFGDSSLEGAGGYSVDMGFWWHIKFPDKIVQRTLLHNKNNKDGKLISINVLEYVTVIIDYCASLETIRTTSFTPDLHPVVLNMTDNTSALSWTLHTCKRSKIGRRLARFFCSLLINSPLGINAQYIHTEENVIADAISRYKKQMLDQDPNSPPSFDYSSLKQNFPELSHCAFFQIDPELLSVIWDILLNEKWPDHDQIHSLKQRPLGWLIT